MFSLVLNEKSGDSDLSIVKGSVCTVLFMPSVIKPLQTLNSRGNRRRWR